MLERPEVRSAHIDQRFVAIAQSGFVVQEMRINLQAGLQPLFLPDLRGICQRVLRIKVDHLRVDPDRAQPYGQVESNGALARSTFQVSDNGYHIFFSAWSYGDSWCTAKFWKWRILLTALDQDHSQQKRIRQESSLR